MSGVAILMPFKNGARFLPAQLASLRAQTMTDWHLLASDDGSDDDSAAIIRDFFGAGSGQVALFDGPRRGSAANVFSLLARVGADTPYVAYCDQDDVWAPDRITAGVAALRHQPEDTPALYCGRTGLIDAAGRAVGASPQHRRAPSFSNALVQNIASGNTMLLNRAAVRLLQGCLAQAGGVVYHDWWSYQLITGAGGRVVYDPCVRVAYRQHGDNAVGMPRGMVRVARAFSRRHGADVSAHLEALLACRGRLSDANGKLLRTFAQSRRGRPIERVRGVLQAGVHRLRARETVTLWACAAMGRL